MSEAMQALLAYQQADEDGVMVLTSRQAIHEVAESHEKLRRTLEQRSVSIDGATSAIVSAMVGSCTCNTKTPEVEHHEGMCRYALLSRALGHLAAPSRI